MAKADPAPRLSKKAYEARVADLRAALVHMQVQLKNAPFPVLVVVAGVDAAGKGDVVNVLNAWLDPRGVETFAFHEPTDEERERPAMWRFWRCLPPHGRMAIYAGGWHTEALREDPRSPRDLAEFDLALRRIARFEDQLTADGALIVKIWLHLSKDDQRARLHELEDDERTAWRVTAEDWKSHRDYDRLARLADTMRRATQRPGAPWHVIAAADPRARNLEVAEKLLARFRAHYRTHKTLPPTAKPRRTTPLRAAGLRRLLALPLDQQVGSAGYEEKRDKWLGKLNRTVRAANQARRSIVWVFEGWDAAGKGGVIRRITGALEAGDYRVIPVASPTEEERKYHYLWRFWRDLPPAGKFVLFDRTWYGRVLVERLEGFAHPAEWQRAFDEINDFEAQMVEHGNYVAKFWLHVSPEEQLSRFKAREDTEYKKHKITAEDYRNRERWDEYVQAVDQMVLRTTTDRARWHVIPANNKQFARISTLKAINNGLARALQKK